ncbi:MAG: glutathione S-transferase family protein [Pseudomonadales bacterium]
MADVHTLYAITHSLYSGRARSYLIKHQIPFKELSTGHESFKADVLPKGKLPTIPTLLTPSGEVIRDGAAIIEHFEAVNNRPSRPPGPRQQIVSALFDVIGAEGLMRPAMHYRWNYPEDNLAFVRYHFLYSQRDTPKREEKTEYMMDRMRHAAMIFGVTEDSKELVETLYLELLDALDTHFEQHPYLLGWQPCVGDFGLIGPLYAHLGRDPYPARLMQQRATRVYRWVERMNRPDQDVPEFFNAGTEFLADDEVPDTLLDVMKVCAEDFVPETLAAVKLLNSWLAEHKPDSGTPAVGRLAQSIGSAQFELRGQTISAMAQPYRFFLLQRVQSLYSKLNASDRTAVDTMLEACGLSPILSATLDRQIHRAENLEVWGD